MWQMWFFPQKTILVSMKITVLPLQIAYAFNPTFEPQEKATYVSLGTPDRRWTRRRRR